LEATEIKLSDLIDLNKWKRQHFLCFNL